MDDVLVSVIMITYKHAEYIDKSILGVLNQECNFTVEIIIADDNSPDNTEEVVNNTIALHPNAYRVKYTRHSVNKGMHENSLWAFKQARGKYFAICEGDDYFTDPKKLQKQVDFLENNKDYGLVFTDADLYYNKSGKFIKSYDKTFGRKIPTGNVLENLVQGNPYKTCTAMFNYDLLRDVYENNIFVRKNFGDKSSWMHIASKSKIGYIPEAMSVYRVLESSASNFTETQKAEEFYMEVYNDCVESAKIYNIPVNKNKLKENYYLSMIKYCIDNNRYLDLRSYVNRSHLIIYIFVKEKILRPIISVLKQ